MPACALEKKKLYAAEAIQPPQNYFEQASIKNEGTTGTAFKNEGMTGTTFLNEGDHLFCFGHACLTASPQRLRVRLAHRMRGLAAWAFARSVACGAAARLRKISVRVALSCPMTFLGPPARCRFLPLFWLGGFAY